MSRNIAVVGISAELPSGPHADGNLDHESFFDLLLSKGEIYERIPADRFNIDAWKGQHLGQIAAQKGGFLKNIDLFDNVEFGVSTKDARAMAPSTRKLLESSFLALVDSGIDYRSRNVGCFTAGITYDITHVSDPNEFDAHGSFAGAPSMIANRISYHLDLLGPSVPTDTACSASCTALHLAINAIICGDCEAAVIAGCQLNLSFMDWFHYSQGSVLSKDGKCKPFDASADGFSRGEGVVAIVIKPLEAAIKDGDRLYGTILGSAINATGSVAPPAAPVAEAQAEAMVMAFDRANRSPKEVDYVECHATGTSKGDPTEVNWVGEHFGRDDQLLIGSVKGNVGHTELAAFLISLSKVLSMFQHRIIPPSVNLVVPNPAINWDKYKLHVPSDPTPLPCRSGQQSLIAIASSGIGGSNAHVVIESPPMMKASAQNALTGPVLLTVGGLSPRSANFMIESINKLATSNLNNLPALAVKLGRQTRQMTWRSFAVVDETNVSQSKFSQPSLTPHTKPPITFVFSGQGPQYYDMGREFFNVFPVFRDSVLDSDNMYTAVTGKSLVRDFGLFGSSLTNPFTDPWPIRLTLPSLVIFQMALFDLLVYLGIKPDIVLGHSAGETAVLYASGAGSKGMVIELAIARGEAFSLMETFGGGMAALSCSPYEARKLLDLVNADCSSKNIVDLACFNAPDAVAIAGPVVKIDQILLHAESRGIFCRKIKTRVPVHSSMMESCRDQYQNLVEDVFGRYPGSHHPHIPTYSTYTGGLFGSTFDPKYFWDNTRHPVLFTQAIECVVDKHPNAVFIEISPHPILSAYMTTIVSDSLRVLASARRPRKGQGSLEHISLLVLLGQLTVAGHNSINLTRVHNQDYPNHELKLPAYPFQKKSFPLYPDVPGYKKQLESRNGPLNHRYLKINKDTHPSLAEHIVRGEPLMPASAFLEMALEFGATALIEVNLRSILSLSSDKPTEVKVLLDGSYWSIRSGVTTLSGEDTAKLGKLHADGYLSFEQPSPAPPDLDLPAIRNRCDSSASTSFYPFLTYSFNYGTLFQRVNRVYYTGEEALIEIRGSDKELLDDGDYILHPAILDACLHIAGFRSFHGNFDANVYYLPARVRSVALHRPPRKGYFPSLIYAYCRVKEWRPDALVYDIAIVDDNGAGLCSLGGLEMAKHSLHHLPRVTNRFGVRYQPLTPPSGSFETREDMNGEMGGMTGTVDHATNFVQTDVSLANADGSRPTINGGDCNNSSLGLYNEDDAHLLWYEQGGEMNLQWLFSGLDPAQQLDVWITAYEGHSADEGKGLTRALRREFLAWTIRFVEFPVSYNESARICTLKKLPNSLQDELEIVISSQGDVLVPRMITLPPPDESRSRILCRDYFQLPLRHVAVRILASSQSSQVRGFVASVVDSKVETFAEGSLVVGLTDDLVNELIVVDSAILLPWTQSESPSKGLLAASIPGLVVAALATSLSCYRHKEHLKTLRVLVTHCESAIGRVISHLYTMHEVNLVEVDEHISLLELSKLGIDSFDVIASGHTDRSFVQIIRMLLRRESGRLFLWNEGETALVSLVKKDPWSISEALKCTLGNIHMFDLHLPVELQSVPFFITQESMDQDAARASFWPDKAYLLLGGIGSLGPHIALWMYERGARHIILTSRSGEATLYRKNNGFPLKIVRYLQTRRDLRLQLEAFDAANAIELDILLKSLSSQLGGCILLTASNSDGLFSKLTKEDFSRVRRATSGVLMALQSVSNVAELDFLVAFSSVSAAFGNGGQANYSSSKTLVDGMIEPLNNAFSFVCPPISSTKLVIEAGLGQKSSRSLPSWQVPAQEMIASLEDAFCKLQSGHHFSLYIPEFDWKELDRTLGMTKMGLHLLPLEPGLDRQIDTEEGKDEKLLDIVLDHLGVVPEDLSFEVPLTSYGLDSLSASRLSFTLLRELAIEVSQIQLLANMTLGDLKERCSSTRQRSDGGERNATNLHRIISGMDELLNRYAIVGPSAGHPNTQLSDDGHVNLEKVVLITGTTGALGSNIFHQLVVSPSVKFIYALNRPAKSIGRKERQKEALEKEALPPSDTESSKVMLLDYDLAAPEMGLSEVTLNMLSSSVTHIIHCAWKSDFTSQLPSFEDLIKGTRSLIDFALNSKLEKAPAISFISSVSVCRFAQSPLSVIEEPISLEALQGLDNIQLSDMSGYIQSKWVAEQMVNLAGATSLLQTSIIRVGQLTGGLSGAWDTSQWFPAMIKSALYVDCLPDGDDIVSWLPVHTAAAAIVEMFAEGRGTVHVVHPRPVTWRSIMQSAASIMNVQLVPYVHWFNQLEASVHVETPLSQHGENPALRLIDFFRQGIQQSISRSATESMRLLPRVSVERGKKASITLRSSDIAQIGRVDVEGWLKYWSNVGFLPSSNA